MDFDYHLANFGWDYFALYAAVGGYLGFARTYPFEEPIVQAYAVRSAWIVLFLTMVWCVSHIMLNASPEYALGWTIWSAGEILTGYLVAHAVLRFMPRTASE